MPHLYPKNSFIVKDGNRRKVLEELGDLRFTSSSSSDVEGWETAVWREYHVAELERDGWKVEGEAGGPGTGSVPKCPHSGEILPGRMVTRCGECGGVKAAETHPAWKPGKGDPFDYVSDMGDVTTYKSYDWDESPLFAEKLIAMGNCYPVGSREAEKAAARVREAYRG